MRGGAVAARRAHNPKVGGSNPPHATLEGPQAKLPAVFYMIQRVQDLSQEFSGKYGNQTSKSKWWHNGFRS